MKKIQYIATWTGALLLLLSACKKKLDYTYDDRLNQQPLTPSSIRIINLAGATQLMIGSKKLTSFTPPAPDNTYGPDQAKGTIWFPENGRLGTTFTIPQDFVKASGWVDSISFSSFNGLPVSRPFNAYNDPNNPADMYYVRFRPNPGGFMDSIFRIPRSVSTPVNPSSFKIRLLNLSSTPDANSLPGVYRQGPMSLAWADGTLIPGLSNVQPNSYSPYIEVPYGTWQLKVLDANGREVEGNSSLTLNPASGTILDQYGAPAPGAYADTRLTYAPIKTFQPGGVYTIVVSMNYDAVVSTGNPNGETSKTDANTWRILSDISEPVNTAWGRIQGVNALPGQEVNWLVNDQPLGLVTTYGKSGSYGRYVTGPAKITATAKDGSRLAETTWPLQPGDNISAWIFPGQDGKPTIIVAANNLSAKFYGGNASEDGSYSMYKDGFPTWLRFLNLCPDLPEATFTRDNGQNFPVTMGSVFATATQHILFGKPVTQDPYAQLWLNTPGQILAYASQPGILPGDWLMQVPTLTSKDFIANPALYPGPYLPNKEPGIYTVALTGSLKTGARMIVVKHIQ